MNGKKYGALERNILLALREAQTALKGNTLSNATAQKMGRSKIPAQVFYQGIDGLIQGGLLTSEPLPTPPPVGRAFTYGLTDFGNQVTAGLSPSLR